MALLPAVRPDEVGAIARTIDRHFALGPAVNRADFLALRGAIPLGASFVAYGTNIFDSHSWLPR